MKIIVAPKAGFCWGVKRAIEIAERARQKAGGIVYVLGHLVHNEDDVESLPFEENDKVGVVMQTTFNTAKMPAIIQRLKERFPRGDILVRETICPDVIGRQNEIRALASKVDAVVVVGSKSSSNTTRLFEIAQEVCPQTYFVSRTVEPIDLHGVATIAVTGGASTPDWMIEEVVAHLNHRSLNEPIVTVNSPAQPLTIAVGQP